MGNDRGDGAVGYLAATVVVASIAGALITSDVATDISTEAAQAVCRVTREDCTDREPAGDQSLKRGPHSLASTGPAVDPQMAGGQSIRRSLTRVPFNIYTLSSENSRTLTRRDGEPPPGNQTANVAPAENLVYGYLTETGEYFKDRFNRNSYDGQGSAVEVDVTKDTVATRNIKTDRITLGGDHMALDSLAHEFTHNVTGSSVSLPYCGESGALDESIADIFASNIDDEDWQIGEDFKSYDGQSIGPIRDLSNPTLFGQPAHTRDYVSTVNDSGGVHINSGITNYAYYQLTNAIGRKSSEQIVYRAVTDHLVDNASLEDFRTANLRAAEELYGEDSPQYRAVDTSFANVGLDGNWKSPRSLICMLSKIKIFP